jgi:hypothetical protein
MLVSRLFSDDQRINAAAYYSNVKVSVSGFGDVWRVFVAGKVKSFSQYSPSRSFSNYQPFFTDTLGSTDSCITETPILLSMTVTATNTQYSGSASNIGWIRHTYVDNPDYT